MRTDDFDFHLPPELIAQAPTDRRSDSRLLHYHRADRSLAHRRFSDLPALLRAGDMLVLNDARVLPARLTLRKATGGLVGGLFIREIQGGQWEVLLRDFGLHAGVLTFEQDPALQATVIERGEGGLYRIELNSVEAAAAVLDHVGRMPLPPYIRREKSRDDRDALDRERYQTVFGRHPGAVAAPTAALHFTNDLLSRLQERGIDHCFVTLYVGMGTFKSVTVDRFEDHPMHAESYTIDATTADVLNAAKSAGRRLVAVGTTSARVLESQPAGAAFVPRSDVTSIFIHPPYTWRHVDALITNFHMPRTTLLGLVAALTGLDEQRRIYQAAIAERYRFFSYGDAMLVE